MVFPPQRHDGVKHLHCSTADLILKQAAGAIGLEGVNIHSFRRTGIPKYHAGVDLTTLQKRTGHVSMANLALYIDVPQAAMDAADNLLSTKRGLEQLNKVISIVFILKYPDKLTDNLTVKNGI